jgi:centromere protein I
VKISKTLDVVSSKAYEYGLPTDLLDMLVELITTPNELDQASTTTIIRNLYPASKVSDDVVVKVVGSLGHGKAKAAFPAQAALLKWLVMVYDVLENQRILSQLYSFLFNLLDTIAIRYHQALHSTQALLIVLGLLFVIYCL